MLKDTFLQSVVQINCIPVLIIIFLFFFLKTNYQYEKAITKQFIPSVILLLCLIVIDNIDYYAYDILAGIESADTFHRFIAMLGYDIRIILMASLIAISAKRIFAGKHSILLTYLPALINVVILLPCLFTDIFFYYNPDGTIGRGPLAYEPHFLSAVYMMFLFAVGVSCRRRAKYTEMGFLILSGTLTIAGFLAEFLFSLRGILIGVVALDITFYYLYLHIEHFRFDALTGILNRDAFIADVSKYGGRGIISHVLSIDLNDLKKLNDTYGHNEGDKALRAIAFALNKKCLPGSFVYRVGGDEFAAICINRRNDEAENMIAEMYAEVEKAGYSCAIGCSEWDNNKTFTEIYKEADDKMYSRKREMKQGRDFQTA
ncbi:MAG: GGDEF domain-containing protein [Ruminiclostridium sp.]|nr:GGDEF domain-containing protein [Ruminiclostridium sp.]